VIPLVCFLMTGAAPLIYPSGSALNFNIIPVRFLTLVTSPTQSRPFNKYTSLASIDQPSFLASPHTLLLSNRSSIITFLSGLQHQPVFRPTVTQLNCHSFLQSATSNTRYIPFRIISVAVLPATTLICLSIHYSTSTYTPRLS